MNKLDLYNILYAISVELIAEDDSFKILPKVPVWEMTLDDLEIDMLSAQDYFKKLEMRIPTKRFRIQPNLNENLHLLTTIGDLCDHLIKCFERPIEQEIVYVDDEEENGFIFKRQYGKLYKIKTFIDPVEALDYIVKTPKVSLVITDESMPKLSGNSLCDEVKKSKPNLKFILITGNPNNDGDLQYRSLRKNRFFDFISKPVDFENKSEEYLKMINSILFYDS